MIDVLPHPLMSIFFDDETGYTIFIYDHCGAVIGIGEDLTNMAAAIDDARRHAWIS